MSKNISKYVLYALLAISVVIAIVFFFGGNVDDNAEYLQPNFTGTLLNWTYILLGVVCVATIGAALTNFILKLKQDPKGAIINVIVILLLALLLLITYLTGDTTPIKQIASDVSQDNTSLQLADMCLKSGFILAFIAILSTLTGWIAKKF